MSLSAQVRYRQAFLLLSGGSQIPSEPGLWILDLDGLQPEAMHREIALRSRQASETGSELRVLSSREDLDAPCSTDLTGMLRDGLQGLDLKLTIPALLHYVPAVRRFFAGRIGDRFGAKAAFNMELVLDELCHNAIDHGAPFPSLIEIEVSSEISILRYSISNAHTGEKDREASMRDRIERFDSSGAYLGERGRGLFLVGRMMDGMTIDAEEGRIWVRTWKDLSAFAG